MLHLECPSCKSPIENNFKFCPFCSFKLDDKEDSVSFSLDPANLANVFGAIENPAPLANRAKKRLKEIGKEFGYEVFIEYYNPKLGYSEKQKRIGVVWMEKGKVIVAFQVRAKRSDFDMITSKRDLEALKKLDAEQKFIVYVSKITGKAYFNKIDDDTPLQKRRAINVPNNIEEIRNRIPRAYEMWNSKEEEDLIKEFQSGLQPYKIAKMHERGTGAIFSRLKKLGLIQE